MEKMRIGASVFVALFLIALCIFLMPSAFALPTWGARGEIGAGALPQFVVVVVPIFAIAILTTDIMAYRRGQMNVPIVRDGEAEVAESDPRRVLGLGSLILLMLALYAVLWRYIGFPLASMAFMAAMALVFLPPESRNLRGITLMAITTLIFCVGTWTFFVHVLGVPLR